MTLLYLELQRILGAEGYNIITAEKGEDALKKIVGEEFDLTYH